MRLPNIKYVLVIPGDCPPLLVHRGVVESKKSGEARQQLWQRKATSLPGVEMEGLVKIEPEHISIVDIHAEGLDSGPWCLQFIELPNPSILDRLLAPFGIQPGSSLAFALASGKLVHLSLPQGKMLEADLSTHAKSWGCRYIIGPRPEAGKTKLFTVLPVPELVLGWRVTVTAQAREVMRTRGLVLITSNNGKPSIVSAPSIRKVAELARVM